MTINLATLTTEELHRLVLEIGEELTERDDENGSASLTDKEN